MKRLLHFAFALVGACLAAAQLHAQDIQKAPTLAALQALPSYQYTTVLRTGYRVEGDVPPQLYTSSSAPCPLSSGTGDTGSQVKSADGNCWTAPTTDPRQYGLSTATATFYSVTATAGQGAITLGGANVPASCANACYIVILGAGPSANELHYNGQIISGSGSAVTVSPAPTQSMTAFSTIVYYGLGNATPLNRAFATGQRLGLQSTVPGGFYLIEAPVTCPVINYNNLNAQAPLCNGDQGATLIAVNAMGSSSPVAGTAFTIGGYANSGDFTQLIRESRLGGLTVDANFIAPYAVGLPWSQDTHLLDVEGKNWLTACFHLGSTGSPQPSAGFAGSHLRCQRDIFNIPISNISSTTAPVVTTSIDHGVPTGRIVAVIGANNVPQPGPLEFLWTSTGARTGVIHDVNGSGWVAFTGTANLALTFPSNSIVHTISGVSAANPGVITLTQGDLNIANGQTWCVQGVAGTGVNGPPPTNVPDGCSVIANVAGSGADGPFQFTGSWNTTGFAYVSGGIAWQQTPLADIGFYLDNITDPQITESFVHGVRWGTYGNVTNAGYNGSFSGIHTWNFAEQGWMQAGAYLGGANTLTKYQCDVPVINCLQFVAFNNTAQGSYLTGNGFNWICDNCAWFARLDTGSDLVVNGGGETGQSGSIRVNEISNYINAGTPSAVSATNYRRNGFRASTGNNALFFMPDTSPDDLVRTGTPLLGRPGIAVSGCTGLGTGSSCALRAGSNSTTGMIRFTTGTTPAATGAFILTWPTQIYANSVNCTFNAVTPQDAGGTFWTPPAAFTQEGNGIGTGGITFQWNNGAATALTGSAHVDIAYVCLGT